MSHFCWLFVLWQDHLGDLCTAIRNKDAELARRWSKSEQWCTVIQLMQAANGKMVPSISFFFPVIFCPSFFFVFFVSVFFIEFSQPPERGSICWYWLVKFFLLVQQLFFLQYNFNKIGTKRLQYILFFCFYKSKFHIVILFSLYKLIYLIRHLCLRLKYSLPSPLTRATRIRGGGHGWYVPFPQWCRLVVQALYVYEPTQTRELWNVWLASTLRKVIKSLLEIIIAKSQDETAGQTTRHRIQIIV